MKHFLVSLLLVMTLGVPYAQAKPVITLVATEWSPFTSSTLPNKGFYAHLVTEAFNRAGYTPVLRFLPWKRALLQTMNGNYDVLLGASYTHNRSQHLLFSTWGWPVTLSFFTTPDKKTRYNMPEDLCPAKVGILRGSFLKDVLRTTPCLVLSEAGDVLAQAQKLKHNRIDYFIESVEAVAHLKQTHQDFNGSTVQVHPPLFVDNSYIAISKAISDHTQLRRKFDNAMQEMQEDGTYAHILQQHGIADPQLAQ